MRSRRYRASAIGTMALTLLSLATAGLSGLLTSVPKADASAGYYFSAPPKVACTPAPGVTVPAGTHVADRNQILYMIQTGQIAFQFFQAGQAHPTVRFLNVYNASACHIDAVMFWQLYKVFYPEGHPLRYAGQELVHQEGPYTIPAGYGLQFAYDGPQCALQIDFAIGAPTAHAAGVIENHMPLCQKPAPPPPTPQCRDGQDNDGDGAADYPNDFSCANADDNDETNPKAACQDGADNDGDGLVDFPQDPGCTSKQDNDESNPAPQTTLTVQKTGPATVAPGAQANYHIVITNTGTAPATGVRIFDRLAHAYGLTFVGSSVAGCTMSQPPSRPDLDQVECPSLGTIPAGQSYQLDFSYRFPVNATCNGVYTDSAFAGANNAPAVTSEVSTTVQCASSSSSMSSSSSSVTPQCRDGIDNDNDGATDFPADFSCSNADDNDETLPKAQCQDGTDNDGDNLVDINDPGCHTDGNAGNPNSYNRQDNDEFNAVSSSSSSMSSSSSSVSSAPRPQCSDGMDNDNDTKIDYLDPGCYMNGVYNPNDNDETDPVQSSSSSSARPQCSDYVDNDHDGKIDYQDPGCYTNGQYNPNDNDETDPVQSSSSSSARPQCSDYVDNDHDGKIDYQDPGCYTNGQYNPNDNDETDPVQSSSSSSARPQCSDGLDNDNDTKIDYLDPGCYTNGTYNPNDNDETNAVSSSSSSMSSSSSSVTPQCRDGIDNDYDGATDYPHDFSCSGPDDNDETNPKAACQDGVDNDHDGKIDFPQDPGCTSKQDNDEYNAVSSSSSSVSSAKPQCSDSQDNDHDGKIDYQDPGCYTNGVYNPNDNDETNAASSSSSSVSCNWCGGGSNNTTINSNANTTVNNQVNAGAQNNTGVWQIGGGNQTATVTPTANTEVNNQVNAGSENNIGVVEAGGNNSATINAGANTGVNNQINALSQNNTGVWQIGGGNGSQTATVTPTANTQVNNQVNAFSQNNIWAKLFSWWK